MYFVNEFNKCQSDAEKWKLVINNQALNITVMLDNDDTFLTFDNNEEADCLSFIDYIGNSYGVVELLEAVGVKCEHV